MNDTKLKTWDVDFSRLDSKDRERWRLYLADPLKGSRFHNPWTTEPKIKTSRLLQWQLSKNPHRPFKPHSPKPEPVHFDFSRQSLAAMRVAWLGHASVLIDMSGLRLVIDPVQGDIANGLVKRAGKPLSAEWGKIDAVMLTHGHFDHFDRASLKALAACGDPPLFIVPRGLGRYLPKLCRRRLELNWWQGVSLGDVEIVLVPAQHWHRRGIGDTNRALWGGYVVRGEQSVYHSGDTGFFEGFAAIAGVLGAIDVACLPAGAYEPRWFMGPQHMAPEDSAKAAALLGARHIMAMHWGTFDLSDECISAGPDLLRRAMHACPQSLLHVLHPGGYLGFENAAWHEHGAWHGGMDTSLH